MFYIEHKSTQQTALCCRLQNYHAVWTELQLQAFVTQGQIAAYALHSRSAELQLKLAPTPTKWIQRCKEWSHALCSHALSIA